MTDASAAMAAVSIGNYKGVMLCNRPFNGVSTTLAKETRAGAGAGSTAKATFLTGIPTEPLGTNVSIHTEPLHAVKRDKKNTALSKHKKWLHDLQRERARLQQELETDEAQKQQTKERFSQREAKFREAVRSNAPECDDAVDTKDTKAKAAAKLRRPMWALTKETADAKLELLDDDEADDLIDFANNLNLDQFMDDVEIKARVAQVEQQMVQLQSIVDHEEAEEKRLEREQQRLEDKSSPMNGNDLLRWKRDGANDDDDDDDARSVASSVLSECKSIRSVHSLRSVAALTKRAEAKLATGEDVTPETTAVNPRVVTIDEEQGARMAIKTLPSNLPYIHRNPAI